jgi:NAD(P)-dependent dehydrogenase (short-subunit alcohol dehydrogenase family)
LKNSTSTSTNFSLQDKVIVVTGGTGILGGAFVQAIAAAGGIPVILGRNTSVAMQRADQIIQQGGIALAVTANVLDMQQLTSAKERIVNKLGTIHGLVNAAGGNLPEGVLSPSADVFDLNLTGMKAAMDLNIWGTVFPTQVFGQVMAQHQGGSIVNISSVTSQVAVSRVLGYSMGKAAVDCFTKWMAIEMATRFGEKIRVNSIIPGFFITEQNRQLLTQPDGTYTERGSLVIQHTPFKRFGQPEELNGALIYLLSDASGFVNGAEIRVDGAFTAFSGV